MTTSPMSAISDDLDDDLDDDGYRLIRPLRVRAIPPAGEPMFVYEFDGGVAPTPASVSSAHRSRCHSDTHP
jgi:hypothetical protein